MNLDTIEAKASDNTSENESSSDKKRYRITRACDYCRRKKVKCHFMPGQACNNCVALGITCQFNDGYVDLFFWYMQMTDYIYIVQKNADHLKDILTLWKKESKE
ncbi:MAG: hypothetical protein EXX96DRAFT_544597 [Benjaminiella poitrasii]|nr:MAG: hypothetical protein EXX96DRAFT_544597 [Benjaminiella poitrasii]